MRVPTGEPGSAGKGQPRLTSENIAAATAEPGSHGRKALPLAELQSRRDPRSTRAPTGNEMPWPTGTHQTLARAGCSEMAPCGMPLRWRGSPALPTSSRPPPASQRSRLPGELLIEAASGSGPLQDVSTSAAGGGDSDGARQQPTRAPPGTRASAAWPCACRREARYGWRDPWSCGARLGARTPRAGRFAAPPRRRKCRDQLHNQLPQSRPRPEPPPAARAMPARIPSPFCAAAAGQQEWVAVRQDHRCRLRADVRPVESSLCSVPLQRRSWLARSTWYASTQRCAVWGGDLA